LPPQPRSWVARRRATPNYVRLGRAELRRSRPLSRIASIVIGPSLRSSGRRSRRLEPRDRLGSAIAARPLKNSIEFREFFARPDSGFVSPMFAVPDPPWGIGFDPGGLA